MGMRRAAVMAGLASGLMAGHAEASYMINIAQSGANVIATGSGSIALSGTAELGSDNAFVAPSFGTIALGSGTDEDVYDVKVTPASGFGPGGLTLADDSSGLRFGFNAFGLVAVPVGYQSGDDLGVSTAVFDNATLASLGLTPGHYVYDVSPAVTSFAVSFAVAAPNTITLNIGTVPLPASAPMFGVALMALGAVGYSLKRNKAAAAA